MNVIEERRPQHRLGAGRWAQALHTVVRGARKVQDEQTRMWGVFRRVAFRIPAPRTPAGESGHAPRA
jgi:hypothetical protein